MLSLCSILLIPSSVLNNADAYKNDIHYDWTFFLALKTGFTWEEAHLIASGNQLMDNTKIHPDDDDEFESAMDAISSYCRTCADWHAFEPLNDQRVIDILNDGMIIISDEFGTEEVRVISEEDVKKYKEIFNNYPNIFKDGEITDAELTILNLAAIKERKAELYEQVLLVHDKNFKLVKFGQLIHYVQDSWSHDGYGSFVGHLLGGNIPDLPNHDAQKFRGATVETINYMKEFSEHLTGTSNVIEIGTNSCNDILIIMDEITAHPTYWNDGISEARVDDYKNNSISTIWRSLNFHLIGDIPEQVISNNSLPAPIPIEYQTTPSGDPNPSTISVSTFSFDNKGKPVYKSDLSNAAYLASSTKISEMKKNTNTSQPLQITLAESQRFVDDVDWCYALDMSDSPDVYIIFATPESGLTWGFTDDILLVYDSDNSIKGYSNSITLVGTEKNPFENCGVFDSHLNMTCEFYEKSVEQNTMPAKEVTITRNYDYLPPDTRKDFAEKSVNYSFGTVNGKVWLIPSQPDNFPGQVMDNLFIVGLVSQNTKPGPVKTIDPSLIIPSWVKSNAGWWSDGTIDDKAFVSGIEFLIKEEIIHISDMNITSNQNSEKIPDWVKSNAGWWSQGSISDDDFLKGIQFMVENGIISVSQTDLTKSEVKTESQVKQQEGLEKEDNKEQVTIIENQHEQEIPEQPETKGTENLSIKNFEASRPVARGVSEEVLILGEVADFKKGDKIDAIIQDPTGQVEEHKLVSGDGTYRLPFLVYHDTEKGEYKITIKYATQQYQDSFFVK